MSHRRREYDVVFYQPYISALYAPRAGLPSGGAEAQVQMIARALATRGWRVGVMANPLPGLPTSVDGVELILRPRRRQGGPLSRAWSALVGWLALTRLNTRVLVKRVAGFDTALVALAARLRGRRFVYSSSNVIDFDFSRLDSRLNAALFALGVRLADEIVVQTDEQEELCLRAFGRHPAVIKSIAEPAPERTEMPRAFLWVGRLVHYKRPLAFVELARAVPAARFEMVAVFPGDYDRELYRRIVSAERELDNLTMVPPQSRLELGRLLESAVAVVNTAEYEGMPNVFLEGWVRGVPALALHHDPDGVIEREGLGAFAAGSHLRFIELARAMWASRFDQTEVSKRCRDYIAREHAPALVAQQWAEVLTSRRDI